MKEPNPLTGANAPKVVALGQSVMRLMEDASSYFSQLEDPRLSPRAKRLIKTANKLHDQFLEYCGIKVPEDATVKMDIFESVRSKESAKRRPKKGHRRKQATGSDVPPDEHSAVFNVLDCGGENEPPETEMTER